MDRVPSDDPLVRLVWSARIWESLVAEGQRQGAAVGDRYLEIKYEDVVREPDRTLSELGEFAGVDLSVARIRESNVAALGRGNTAYGEKMEGIAKQGLDRWRTELDADEREALEWAIGYKLQELGYLDSLNDRSGSGISLNYRLHSVLAPVAFRGRRWLTHHTPLGRATSGPLEMGLD